MATTLGKTHFNVGSRKSKLAMIQTNAMVAALQKANPSFTFNILEQETIGDKIQDVALSKIGDKGLFTQELEQDMMDGKIDFAVHSLKDLPTQLPQGLTLGCITERVLPNDAVLIRSDLTAKGYHSLEDLNRHPDPAARTVGTSALRRHAQIGTHFPDLKCMDCRGNVDTRINKLNRGDFAAIILAYAGLYRQGESYTDLISETLSDATMFYAVGQGALGVECREGDEEVLKLLSSLHHEPTAHQCTAERAFMRTLEGGCHAPIGVSSSLSFEGSVLTLKGRVMSLDGKTTLESSVEDVVTSAEHLGTLLAKKLLDAGAADLLKPTATNVKEEAATTTTIVV
jgi:hydroxymethylbilane synthase